MYTFRAGRFNHRLASLSTPNERRPVKCFAERLDVNFSPALLCVASPPILIPTPPLPLRFPCLLNCLCLRVVFKQDFLVEIEITSFKEYRRSE